MSKKTKTSLPSANTRSKTLEHITGTPPETNPTVNPVSKVNKERERLAGKGELLNLGGKSRRLGPDTSHSGISPETRDTLNASPERPGATVPSPQRKNDYQNRRQPIRKRHRQPLLKPHYHKRGKVAYKRKRNHRKEDNRNLLSKRQKTQTQTRSKSRGDESSETDSVSPDSLPEDSNASNSVTRGRRRNKKPLRSSGFSSNSSPLSSSSSRPPTPSSPSSSSSETDTTFEPSSGASSSKSPSDQYSDSTISKHQRRHKQHKKNQQNKAPKINVRVTKKDRKDLEKAIGANGQFDVNQFGRKPKPLSNKNYTSIEDPTARITAKTQDIIRAHWDHGGWEEFQKTPGILPLSKPLWTAIAKNTTINLGEFLDDAIIEAARYIEPSVTIGSSITIGTTPRKTRPITNKFLWISAFNQYKRATLSLYKHREHELEEYKDRIIGLFGDYPFQVVAEYDREKRTSILLHREKTLLTFDHRIETKHFNGATPRLQNFAQQSTSRSSTIPSRICRDWNRGPNQCRFGARCQYIHRCIRCNSTDHSGNTCNNRNTDYNRNTTSGMGRFSGTSSIRGSRVSNQAETERKNQEI